MRAARGLARVGAAFALSATAAPCSADPLKLEPGKPAEIACDTKSVVVATDAANATSGNIRLKLEVVQGGDAAKPAGTWSVIAVDAAHKGSFAAREKEACAKGCPLAVGPDGAVQIWAPGPKALASLADGEALLLAVIKPATLALRASTFRGKDIEALEEGTCRVAPAP
jgi:hypothetical protein